MGKVLFFSLFLIYTSAFAAGDVICTAVSKAAKSDPRIPDSKIDWQKGKLVGKVLKMLEEQGFEMSDKNLRGENPEMNDLMRKLTLDHFGVEIDGVMLSSAAVFHYGNLGQAAKDEGVTLKRFHVDWNEGKTVITLFKGLHAREFPIEPASFSGKDPEREAKLKELTKEILGVEIGGRAVRRAYDEYHKSIEAAAALAEVPITRTPRAPRKKVEMPTDTPEQHAAWQDGLKVLEILKTLSSLGHKINPTTFKQPTAQLRAEVSELAKEHGLPVEPENLLAFTEFYWGHLETACLAADVSYAGRPAPEPAVKWRNTGLLEKSLDALTKEGYTLADVESADPRTDAWLRYSLRKHTKQDIPLNALRRQIREEHGSFIAAAEKTGMPYRERERHRYTTEDLVGALKAAHDAGFNIGHTRKHIVGRKSQYSAEFQAFMKERLGAALEFGELLAYLGKRIPGGYEAVLAKIEVHPQTAVAGVSEPLSKIQILSALNWLHQNRIDLNGKHFVSYLRANEQTPEIDAHLELATGRKLTLRQFHAIADLEFGSVDAAVAAAHLPKDVPLRTVFKPMPGATLLEAMYLRAVQVHGDGFSMNALAQGKLPHVEATMSEVYGRPITGAQFEAATRDLYGGTNVLREGLHLPKAVRTPQAIPTAAEVKVMYAAAVENHGDNISFRDLAAGKPPQVVTTLSQVYGAPISGARFLLGVKDHFGGHNGLRESMNLPVRKDRDRERQVDRALDTFVVLDILRTYDPTILICPEVEPPPHAMLRAVTSAVYGEELTERQFYSRLYKYVGGTQMAHATSNHVSRDPKDITDQTRVIDAIRVLYRLSQRNPKIRLDQASILDGTSELPLSLLTPIFGGKVPKTKLVALAKRDFGSWNDALVAAGVPIFDTVKKAPKSTRYGSIGGQDEFILLDAENDVGMVGRIVHAPTEKPDEAAARKEFQARLESVVTQSQEKDMLADLVDIIQTEPAGLSHAELALKLSTRRKTRVAPGEVTRLLSRLREGLGSGDDE